MPSTPLKTVRSRYAEAWVATGTAPETFRQPPTATVPNIPKVASEEQADDLSVVSPRHLHANFFIPLTVLFRPSPNQLSCNIRMSLSYPATTDLRDT